MALKLLSEWSHFRISYTDLHAKVRMTLYCTIQFNSIQTVSQEGTVQLKVLVPYNSIQFNKELNCTA